MLGMLAGCGGHDERRPPIIRYGQETCAQCRMLIAEEPFAAALVVDGEMEKFDDLGCLLRAWVSHARPEARVWVHDHASAAWLDGRTAVYLLSSQLVSPMGSGLAAFADEAAAQAAAEQWPGRVMRFDDLPAAIVAPVPAA